MKLSKSKLRKLIMEQLLLSEDTSSKKYGTADPDSVLLHSLKRKIKEDKLNDAKLLFESMYGLGTTESVIKDIIRKRELKKTLVELYDEYTEYLDLYIQLRIAKAKSKHPALAVDTLSSLAQHLDLSSLEGDLISWLSADGEDTISQQVRDALSASGRSRVNVTAKGIIKETPR